MDDLILVLVLVLIAYFVYRWLTHGGGNLFVDLTKTAGSAATSVVKTASPYESSLLKGAENAISKLAKDSAQTIGSLSKEVGSLAAKVDRNVLSGYAVAGKKNPVARVSSRSLQHENENTLLPGIESGLSVAGNVGVAGAAAGAIVPDLASSVIQGFASASAAANSLPVIKQIAETDSRARKQIDKWFTDPKKTKLLKTVKEAARHGKRKVG
jgi:hypothetical protein